QNRDDAAAVRVVHAPEDQLERRGARYPDIGVPATEQKLPGRPHAFVCCAGPQPSEKFRRPGRRRVVLIANVEPRPRRPLEQIKLVQGPREPVRRAALLQEFCRVDATHRPCSFSVRSSRSSTSAATSSTLAAAAITTPCACNSSSAIGAPDVST